MLKSDSDTKKMIPDEELVRIARIIEDVAKIHGLYKEIDTLPDVPQKIRVQLDRLIETMEMLNLLKVASITGHNPRDYESTYTKIKRGTAYAKRGAEWVRLGSIKNPKTLEKLIRLRESIAMDTLALFETMGMDEKEKKELEKEKTEKKGEKKEILEQYKRLQMSEKTLAIILRNVSERLLFNEQDQSAALEGIYGSIKEKIEREHQKKSAEFSTEMDMEIEKANQNYQKYLYIKRNRAYEEELKEALEIKEKSPENFPEFLEAYGYNLLESMPPYFTDPNGLVGKIFGRESDKGEDSKTKELLAKLDELVSERKESGIEKEFMEKLRENRERVKSTFYPYLEQRDREKAEKQVEMIKDMGGEKILHMLKGAVEDMVVMRRLHRQIERMELSNETKIRFSAFIQSMELLHMIKTGVISQSHKRDFWEIREGAVYLKSPEIKFWNVVENEIKLGKITDDRDIVVSGIKNQRTWAFKEVRKNIKEDVKKMDSEKIAELLENIGRRLVFNQQDQHLGLIKLVEIAWGEFEEKYKNEKEKIDGMDEGEEKDRLFDEFALKSDRIARYIDKTIKYIEGMKTDDKEAIEIRKKLTAVMEPFYRKAKEANIIRMRGEDQIHEGEIDVYLTPVKKVNELVPQFVEEIEKGGKENDKKKNKKYGPSNEELENLLREIEGVDPDKVLLVGARHKAFPLLHTMRQIIRMVESNRYNEYDNDRLEKLFEIAAVQISKFAIRFQIPVVLKESGEIRDLNFGESLFMVDELLSFLETLEKWEKIRAPYFEYMMETAKALERISQETLCPNIKDLANAYYIVQNIVNLTRENEGKTKEQAAEIIGYVADRAMVIDLESDKENKDIDIQEKLDLSTVLYVASKYTGNEEYKEYINEKYKGFATLAMVRALKNIKEDPSFYLTAIEMVIEDEKKLKLPNDFKKVRFNRLLELCEELIKDVKDKWEPQNINKLNEIKKSITNAINDMDMKENNPGTIWNRGTGRNRDGNKLGNKGKTKR